MGVPQRIELEQLDPAVSAALTSAIVSDSLDAVGLRRQVMDPAISSRATGVRALGRAATVQFEPTDHDSDHPYDEVIAFIDTLQAGAVAVLATDGNLGTGYWGELFSAAAIGRGAVGMVCDGPVRDVAKIRALSFPAFSVGSRPLDLRARVRVSARDTAVCCGGVIVQPGDLVLADEDGVVVVPHNAEEEVLALAVQRAQAETGVLDELLAGGTLAQVWQRWGVL